MEKQYNNWEAVCLILNNEVRGFADIWLPVLFSFGRRGGGLSLKYLIILLYLFFYFAMQMMLKKPEPAVMSNSQWKEMVNRMECLENEVKRLKTELVKVSITA